METNLVKGEGLFEAKQEYARLIIQEKRCRMTVH